MLLSALKNTEQGVGRYVLKAGLIALIPSLAISSLLAIFVQHKPVVEFRGSVFMVVFSVLILSPWIETLMMWPILWFLQKFIKRSVTLAAASAVFWGMLHSLASPLWGLAVAWPFFVFSFCFLQWRRKSIGSAIIATGLTHTFQNLLPAIALAATL